MPFSCLNIGELDESSSLAFCIRRGRGCSVAVAASSLPAEGRSGSCYNQRGCRVAPPLQQPAGPGGRELCLPSGFGKGGIRGYRWNAPDSRSAFEVSGSEVL